MGLGIAKSMIGIYPSTHNTTRIRSNANNTQTFYSFNHTSVYKISKNTLRFFGLNSEKQ